VLISQGIRQLGGRQTTLRWQKQVFIHTGCRTLTWHKLGFLVGSEFSKKMGSSVTFQLS